MNSTNQAPAKAGGKYFVDPQKVAGLFGIREGMRIADFGCGSGFFPIHMAKLTGAKGLVTAVDVLDSALELVKAKAAAEGLTNIATVKGNLEINGSSGLADGSQDFALLANVLFETDKKDQILRETVRVLRIGAGLAVIDWEKSADGFGPPRDSRIDQAALTEMAVNLGFKFVGKLDAGAFHFGAIYRKVR